MNLIDRQDADKRRKALLEDGFDEIGFNFFFKKEGREYVLYMIGFDETGYYMTGGVFKSKKALNKVLAFHNLMV